MVLATIKRALNLKVEQHDDGSEPGMYDLDILAADGSRAAVEVTAAADSDSIELWKLVNNLDTRWIVPGLIGGWMLHLAPTARGRRLHRELPDWLAHLEKRGVTEIGQTLGRETMGGVVGEQARAFGIVSGRQSRTDYPGSIYLTIDQPLERAGGVVDATGVAVPLWIRDFLLDPHQNDVLRKLARSGADDRHAFILIPGFTIAPFGVVDMLLRSQQDVVPLVSPDLPHPVTHVWLMAFWTRGSGLRWSDTEGWQRFERLFRLDS